MQYNIENMLQFSLVNCVEPFLQCVSFSTLQSSLQYVNVFILTQTLDSDCELADLLCVVVDSRLTLP